MLHVCPHFSVFRWRLCNGVITRPRGPTACERSRNWVISPVLQYGSELPSKGQEGKNYCHIFSYHCIHTEWVFFCGFTQTVHWSECWDSTLKYGTGVSFEFHPGLSSLLNWRYVTSEVGTSSLITQESIWQHSIGRIYLETWRYELDAVLRPGHGYPKLPVQKNSIRNQC
jgi:hypothetical protein